MSLQDKATGGKVGRLLKVFLFSCGNLEKEGNIFKKNRRFRYNFHRSGKYGQRKETCCSVHNNIYS